MGRSPALTLARVRVAHNMSSKHQHDILNTDNLLVHVRDQRPVQSARPALAYGVTVGKPPAFLAQCRSAGQPSAVEVYYQACSPELKMFRAYRCMLMCRSQAGRPACRTSIKAPLLPSRRSDVPKLALQQSLL